MKFMNETLSINPNNVNAQELAQELKVDFNLEMIENSFPFVKPNGDLIQLKPESYNIYRTDTYECLNKGTATTKGFTPVKPTEFLSKFLSVTQTLDATITDSKIIGNGARMYFTAKLPQDMLVNDGEVINMYVIGLLCLDGTKSSGISVSQFRQICSNGMGTLDLEGKTKMKLTKNVHFKMETLQERTLSILENSKSIYNELLTKKVSDAWVENTIKDIFGKSESTRATNIRQDVMNSYLFGEGQENIKGTAYGFFNGITHYLSNKDYKTEERLFEGVLNGQESSKINKALKLALAN